MTLSLHLGSELMMQVLDDRMQIVDNVDTIMSVRRELMHALRAIDTLCPPETGQNDVQDYEPSQSCNDNKSD
jgi:hypothetical protein